MRAGWVKRTALFLVTPVAVESGCRRLPSRRPRSTAVAITRAEPAAACRRAGVGVFQTGREGATARPRSADESGASRRPGDLDTWDLTVTPTGREPDRRLTRHAGVSRPPPRPSSGGQVLEPRRRPGAPGTASRRTRRFADCRGPDLPPARPLHADGASAARPRGARSGRLARRRQTCSFTFALPPGRRRPDLLQRQSPATRSPTTPSHGTHRCPTPALTAGNIDAPYATDEYFFTIPRGRTATRRDRDARRRRGAANRFASSATVPGRPAGAVRHGSTAAPPRSSSRPDNVHAHGLLGRRHRSTYRLKLWSVPAAFAAGSRWVRITSTLKQINGSIDQNGEVDTYSFSVAGATTLDVTINTCYTPTTITYPNGFDTAAARHGIAGPDYYLAQFRRPAPIGVAVRADRGSTRRDPPRTRSASQRAPRSRPPRRRTCAAS